MKILIKILFIFLFTFSWLNAQMNEPQTNTKSLNKLKIKKLYLSMQKEIRRRIPGRTRKRYSSQFKSEVFLTTVFKDIPYFKRRRTLNRIHQIQRKFKAKLTKLQTTDNTTTKPLKKRKKIVRKRTTYVSPTAISLSALGFRNFFINVKTGVDYFYIDTGKVIPENNDISITTQPYTYYDLSIGVDFDIVGFDFRLKNSFHGDNISDNYINKEDTVEKSEEAENRERLFSFIGFFNPLQYGRNTQYGLYFGTSFRIFQASAKISNDINFTDSSGTTLLTTGENYTINLFQSSYAIGFMKRIKKSYYDYMWAIGYKYNQIDSPHYVEASNAIETISAIRNSIFIILETKTRTSRYTSETNYGINQFERPNGQLISYNVLGLGDTGIGSIEDFYFSSVKNSYEFKFSEIVNFQFYLGYSGYVPITSSTSWVILGSMGTELYFYYRAINSNTMAYFQPVVQILQYLINKKNTFYADIMLGGQIGIRIDFR